MNHEHKPGRHHLRNGDSPSESGIQLLLEPRTKCAVLLWLGESSTIIIEAQKSLKVRRGIYTTLRTIVGFGPEKSAGVYCQTFFSGRRTQGST